MPASSETVLKIEESLLEGASIRRVIDLKVANAGNDILVGAKVDLEAELTMKEVSVIIAQAKRRIQQVVPEAKLVYIEPDVWLDPELTPPTTSAIVMLGLD